MDFLIAVTCRCDPGHILKESETIIMIREDKHMPSPNALLTTLSRELEFLENGGYRDSPRRWAAPLVFEDGPQCLRPDQGAKSMCGLCPLIDFVPLQHRAKKDPCRHIVLTEDGQTANAMYRTATQEEIEKALRTWLQNRIADLQSSSAGEAKLAG